MDDIRNQYLRDLKSKEIGVRQRAVAVYFIDKVRFCVISRVKDAEIMIPNVMFTELY